MNNEYIFPFSTCEYPMKIGIKQPYSMAMNMLILITLLYYLLHAKNFILQYTYLSYILFELFHTFSHGYHLHDINIQTIIIHLLGYNMAISTLLAIIILSKQSINYYIIFFLICIIIIDVCVYLFYGDIYTIISGLTIFIIVIISFYNIDKKFTIYFILGIIILILLLVNEKYNCNIMLSYWPNFPFHIIIEFMGLILFYFLSNKLLSLENRETYI